MLSLYCPTHRRYQAIKAPKANCQPCWFLFYIRIFCSLSKVAAKAAGGRTR